MMVLNDGTIALIMEVLMIMIVTMTYFFMSLTLINDTDIDNDCKNGSDITSDSH